MAKIIFRDASGEEIGSVDRIRKARWSLQGPSDERQMDAYKQAHPEAATAHIGSSDFKFDAKGKAVQSPPALPPYPSEPGWYCIVFLDENDQPVHGPIYELSVAGGAHVWTDENGDEIEHLFDTFLQMNVAMDAADGYIRQ